MSMENGKETSLFDLLVDHEGQDELMQLARWAKLVSIMGLIMGLVIAFAGLLSVIIGPRMEVYDGLKGLGPIISTISIIVGLIYLYPSWLLLRYATQMPVAIKSNNQQLVNEAFKNLKSCFRFWGILALIILGFYAVAIIIELFSSALR